MKKIIIAMVALVAMVASASAGSLKFDTYIGVGSGTVKGVTFETKSFTATEYIFGTGMNYTFDNKILIGMELDFGVISQASADNVYQSGMDIKAGYNFGPAELYAIGNVIEQSSGGLNAYGFGYGCGAQWNAMKHLAIAAEFKTVDMKTEYSNHYDYETGRLLIKYVY